jgi:hypothetical protein
VNVNYTLPQDIQSSHSVRRFGYQIDKNMTSFSFPSGVYNMRVFVQKYWWRENPPHYLLDEVVTIRNTTFQIV